MIQETFEAALRAFSHRRPFQRYIIEFMSGDRVIVPHPESIVWQGKAYHFLGPDRQNRVFDASSVAQLLDMP